ncbi:MAG: bifunctional enoyl-CoA hydratase/phosphate acetyltransferase [Peptoclostridium sp.]|uniref:bifunctional enoyl-CoA hydratase/phosphate acetyltransferase n=1 Tax=Peptoclostridium sp. TaxID=1904860 RepID=UPI00139BFB0A|nr:bifunctional enoyl-CoA hydratase/phosphate acetyltransferase [Peptoclostridium sp.]MZQ74989.1 bifunctional enoyl-CoA hydratase/phosphate acetyltransferase [Peptoclostridium sp.]
MIKTLEGLLERVKSLPKMKLAVAAAEDREVLHAVFDAKEAGIITPVLVGDVEKIEKIAAELGFSLEGVEVLRGNDLADSAMKAVKLVSQGQADFVMKGLLDTSILLKAVLDKEYGLRTDSLLSHVMVYEPKMYHKLLFITDGGMNIAPELDAKVKILKNAVKAAKAFELEQVKAACIAAKEKVSDKMPSTVDADAIAKLAAGGEFGEGVIVEGPLAFDLAISKEAAQIKKFESQVAGDADILLVPTIEVGNAVGKALTYLADAKSAGIIMGAKAPVVLVSRADSHESKLYSIALGAIIANR